MQYEDPIGLIQTNLATPSLWIGLTTVLLFAIGRFNETRKDLEGLDPPIFVRNFTTKFRYNFAALTYAGLFAIFYMALICVGSIPELQDFLKDSIGSVPGMRSAPGMEQLEVGTPSWAALAITAALPTFPPIARLDQRLREALRNFASIPGKAQSIADEMIAEIRAKPQPSDWGQEIYDRLEEMLKTLRALRRLRAAESYREFFAKNEAMLELIRQKAASLAVPGEVSVDQEQFYKTEWKRTSKRLARLIVCALLTVEVDEYSVRKTLRDDLGLERVQPGQWRFRSSEILFSVAIVVVVTSVAAVATTYFGVLAISDQHPSFELVLLLTERFILAGVLWGPVFLVPLLFCAGMQMYLIDLEHFGEKPEADTRVIFFLMTALGAIGFASLSVVTVGVVMSAMVEQLPNLAQTLPWAGPPALFAIVFVLISRRQLFRSYRWNAAVDFVVHGSVAAASGWCAARLSLAFGLEYQNYAIPFELIPAVATVTSGLIGGTLGTILCCISRMVDQGHVPVVVMTIDGAPVPHPHERRTPRLAIRGRSADEGRRAAATA